MRLYVYILLSAMFFSGIALGQQKAADVPLGNLAVTIKTPVNKPGNSIDFYNRLGFHQLYGSLLTYTDGKVIIEIDTNKSARAGMNFYKPSWKTDVEKVKKWATVKKTKNGYRLSDPSGVMIYLIDSGVVFPPALDSSYSLLGNYQGVTLESGNMAASYELYTALGLHKTKGDAEKGFVELSDGRGFTIVLMSAGSCPHLFFNPSLTYFNGSRNMAVIAGIKAKGIPVVQDITWFSKEGKADNIILRDPGGYGFFIFSD